MAALLIVLALVAKVASAPGQSFFLAIFVDDILVGTDLSRSAFSAIYALATVASAVTVIGIGRMIDRFGISTVWLLVSAGLALACFLLSQARGPLLVLAALCLMRGFGQGSFPLLGTVLIASNFERARGRAMAVATQGITLAGVVMPGLGVALIAAVGWRSGLQVVAVILLLAILPLGVLTRRSRRAARLEGVQAPRLRHTLGRPGVKPLLLILGATPLIATALVLHSVSLLESLGLDSGRAALILGWMAAFIAFGAAAGGLIADRLAPRWSLIAIGVALLAGTLPLLLSTPAAGAAAFAALGAAQGFSATANGTVWARAYGLDEIGQLQGLASSGQIAGAAVGPLVLALSASLTGGYTGGLLLLSGLAAAALVFGARWRMPAERASDGGGNLRLEPVQEPA